MKITATLAAMAVVSTLSSVHALPPALVFEQADRMHLQQIVATARDSFPDTIDWPAVIASGFEAAVKRVGDGDLHAGPETIKRLQAAAAASKEPSSSKPGDTFAMTQIDVLLQISADSACEPGRLEKAFADGVVAAIDRDSAIIWPSDVAIFTQSAKNGQSAGVGIDLVKDAKALAIEVDDVIPGSAAAKGGVHPGDVLTAIDGKAFVGADAALAAIRGAIDSTVTLTIRTGAVDREIKLKRAPADKPASLQIIDPAEPTNAGLLPVCDHVAYARLGSLTKNVGSSVAAFIEIARTSGARAIVLDLRGNTGGLLPEAATVLDCFLPEEPLFEGVGMKDGHFAPTMLRSTTQASDWKGPLVVLVDHGTAAGAEIIAQVLRLQRKDVRLVGEQTFGRGSVQMLFPLGDRDAFFKLTTSRIKLFDGTTIPSAGLTPDVPTPMEDVARRLLWRSWRDRLRGGPQRPAPTTFDPQLVAALNQLPKR